MFEILFNTNINFINISQHSNLLPTCKTAATSVAYRKLEMTGTTDLNTHMSFFSSFHARFLPENLKGT
jgi:hypothetical protein